jgi:hypothetical protein
VNKLCPLFLEEACDLIHNLRVGPSIKAWGVDECKDAAIGCSPAMNTDLKRLGLDFKAKFNSCVLGDELDELFLESVLFVWIQTSAKYPHRGLP